MKEELNEILRIFMAKRRRMQSELDTLREKVKSHHHGLFCFFGCCRKKLEKKIAELEASQKICLEAEQELAGIVNDGYKKTISLLEGILEDCKNIPESSLGPKILERPLTTKELKRATKPVLEQLKEVKDYLINLQGGAIA